MDEIKVLDHGYVKYVEHMGSDEVIIESARMSTGRGFEGWEKDSKLLDFLYRHKHMSPFEMCELSIEVQAPLFVVREWHRHRTQSYNELSARYTKMPDIHYVPTADRLAPKETSNKQESSEGSGHNVENIPELIVGEQNAIYGFYEDMLTAGVPREVARLNTPVSRYTRFRAKTDLRNWLGFLNLRMRENAQWEIRQYANAVSSIVKEHFPRTYALFEEYDLNGVSFSASEMAALRKSISANSQVAVDAAMSLPEKRSGEFLSKLFGK